MVCDTYHNISLRPKIMKRDFSQLNKIIRQFNIPPSTTRKDQKQNPKQ